MKKTISIIIVITILFCLCSCGSKKSELVGRWVQVSGESMEFFKDGTCVIDSNRESAALSASYEITDDGRLKIKPIGYAYLYKYSIENNVLILDGDDYSGTYYLDVKNKKPKEKYLSEDEVIKHSHDTTTKDKSIIAKMAEEDEKIIDCKYLRNYTDKDGFYHAIYEITKVSSEIDNPYTGIVKYPDFRYFASADEWVLYDVMNNSEGYFDTDEISVLLESVVGTWECNGSWPYGEPFDFKIKIELDGKDKYKFSYNYVASIDEKILKSYREKYPEDADKFKNEISGSLSVSKFIGEYNELFSFDGPGYGSQTIYIENDNQGISISSETYLNTTNGTFELKKTE